jgi:simple sugar transport system ATP-binding protein
MLAGPYTALENAVLGAEGGVAGVVPYQKALARLRALSARYGFQIDWTARVETLPVGVQQRIEILKALDRDASVLILDEPTAVLTPQETVELFAQIRKLAASGKSVLIITHKLKEVMSVADRVTVFRAGRVVGHREIKETSPDDLASLMVGRKVKLMTALGESEAGAEVVTGAETEAVLRVESLALQGSVLDGVSFQVGAGEVVGIAGVEGNGQSDLLHVLISAREYARKGMLWGKVSCFGLDASALSTDELREKGMGIVPEDRLRDGLLLERPASESFLLGLHRREPFLGRGGLLSANALEKALASALEEYDVRPRSPDTIAGRMSGGNQQKLIVAREFQRPPKLLIAAQPTRGVDVGAIEFIHGKIRAARDSGAGVLLVSSELDEILALSDRILVMYSGKIVAEFARGRADERELGLCMGGAQR